MSDNDRLITIAKKIYPNDFNAFVKRVFNIVSPHAEFVDNWHIDCVSEYLMACERREIDKLIINIPPRSLKSISASIAFPAWILGKNPREQIIVASHTRSLSYRLSQDTRTVMNDPWYRKIFPNTKLAKDQNEKSKFMTTERGHRMAVSVGSSVIGEGGNYLIIDDPIDPDRAMSEITRTRANDWYGGTFYSRLNDKRPGKGVIILIMQRLHQGDMTGHLLKQDGWEHCCLPAVNNRTRTISIGRFNKEWKEDELMSSELLSHDVLSNIKNGIMNAHSFAGQYMQSPSPEGGGIIKYDWWKYWESPVPPPTRFILQVYDTAYGTKQTNDYSARTTWGIFEDEYGLDNIILLESWKGRVEFPDLREVAIKGNSEYKPDLILIEAKASGQPLIDELKRTGLPIRAIQRNANSGDKVMRAHAVTIIFEHGRVWVPTEKVDNEDGGIDYIPRKGANEVMNDCAIFPKGDHDDIVDTVIDAVAFLRNFRDIQLETDAY